MIRFMNKKKDIHGPYVKFVTFAHNCYISFQRLEIISKTFIMLNAINDYLHSYILLLTEK